MNDNELCYVLVVASMAYK